MPSHRIRSLFNLALIAGALVASLPSRAAEAPVSATIPLEIDDGRPIVELTVLGAGGERATGRFLVDTGGGAFIIPEATARAAGITWTETFQAEGHELGRPDATPSALMAALPLPLNPDRVLVFTEGETGLLPGHVLARHHVIFDYPARTLTLAPPDSVEPVGDPVPMPVSQPMGFPRTEISINGDRVGMLLDTGPAATILSKAVMDRWAEANPGWSYRDGAHGKAEALQRAGGQVLATLIAEQATWAGFDIAPVTLAGQREGVFETWMTRMMTAPIVGALGSNVFMNFRLELDYLNETLYVTRPTAPD